MDFGPAKTSYFTVSLTPYTALAVIRLLKKRFEYLVRRHYFMKTLTGMSRARKGADGVGKSGRGAKKSATMFHPGTKVGLTDEQTSWPPHRWEYFTPF